MAIIDTHCGTAPFSLFCRCCPIPELQRSFSSPSCRALGASLVPGCALGCEQQKTVRRPLTVQSTPIPLCANWPWESQSTTLTAFLDILRSQKPAIQKQIGGFC